MVKDMFTDDVLEQLATHTGQGDRSVMFGKMRVTLLKNRRGVRA
jgi:hypothetical protein